MEVIWTKFAFSCLNQIHKYYREKVNPTIANNIIDNIFACTAQLKTFPQSGPIEELLIDLKKDHRFIVRGHYKIIYKIKDRNVYITDVFDTRQNPDKMMRRNK